MVGIRILISFLLSVLDGGRYIGGREATFYPALFKGRAGVLLDHKNED